MSGRALAALAALVCATPADAYVRTTAEGSGLPLSWPLPAVPYHVNRDFPGAAPSCRATAAGDPTLDAIRRSFAQWEQPCAELRLLYAGNLDEIRVGTVGSSDDLVVFRKGWCSQRPEVVADPCYTDWNADCGSIYGCFEDHDSCAPGQAGCATRAVIALTTVLYDPTSGRIMNADIELNAWDGGVPSGGAPILSQPQNLPQNGWYFTCATPPDARTCQLRGDCCQTYGQDGCFSIDLQNTVTHEAGHFLGLAHSPVSDSTMNANAGPGEITKRTLAADDVAGICAVYPASAGGCGCRGGGGAGALSLLALVLALRPRRPRPVS